MREQRDWAEVLADNPEPPSHRFCCPECGHEWETTPHSPCGGREITMTPMERFAVQYREIGWALARAARKDGR